MKLFFRVIPILPLLVSMALTAHAQTVKGIVTDTSKDPLPGVSVFVESSDKGVVTDQYGMYSINIHDAEGKTLTFSFLGMKTVYEIIGKRSVINVEMEDEATYLNEAVMVGYQTVKRQDLLGAVVSVNENKLREQPVNDIAQALAGKMAGVSVVTTEGDPDADVKIRVRGVGSITQDSSPLVLIDGFPGELKDVAPSQIKSIDVLKDAFSTAIYGSRGASGVILVTTKGGEDSGKISVNLNAYYGLKSIANSDAYKPMDADDYLKLMYETSMIMHGNPQEYEKWWGSFYDMGLYSAHPVNDWLDIIFGDTGQNWSADIAVSGSNPNARWTFNYANIGENAIMMGSSYRRNNLGFKINLKTSKTTSIDVNIRYSNIKVRGASSNNQNDLGASTENGRINQALAYAPLPNSKVDVSATEDMSYYRYLINPVESVTDNDSRSDHSIWNANAAFNWEIIKHLRLKIEGGFSQDIDELDNFMGTTTFWVHNNSNYVGYPANNHRERKKKKYRNTNTLSYDFADVIKNKNHKVSLMAGQEVTINNSHDMDLITEGFPEFYTAQDAWNFMSSGIPYSNSLTYYESDVLLSFFGRINYTLLQKYSLGVTFRADGSSKFGPKNKWGYFPSAAVSWDIAKESFMQNAYDVNQLKLRYSFGTSGNNNIPIGRIYTMYSASSTSHIKDVPYIWSPGDMLANQDLKWETNITHNLGLDFSFFDERINGSLELYKNRTKDLLIRFPITGSGYSDQYQNRGALVNEGIELSLNLPLVRKPNFDLSFSGNISYNRNLVLDLGGLDEIQSSTGWASTEIPYDYKVVEGRPLGDIYGYVVEGIYGVEDFDYVNGSWVLKEGKVDNTLISSRYFRPGSVKLQDKNGDGEINAEDIQVIGNTLPDITGGFSLNIYLYGFDIAANFSFMAGNDVYNANKLSLSNSRSWNRLNLLDDFGVENRWTAIDWSTGELITDPQQLAETNMGKKYWSPLMSQAINMDWAVEDGSFLRLQSATIGYTFPTKLMDKIHIDKLRLYVTGTNLFCLTGYSGYDPEVDCRRKTPLTPGCDFSAFPKSIGVVFGMNLTF